MDFFIWLLYTLVALFLYYTLRRYKPKVYHSPNSIIASNLKKMKTLNEFYRPTPWLISRHLHTVWGMRYRKPFRFETIRQLITFEDKGSSYLDWYQSDSLTNESPILVIIHTLAGGVREPCTNNAAKIFYSNGYRVVVASNRGCSGASFTSAKCLDGFAIEDTNFIVSEIRSKYPISKLFCLGFSLGSFQALAFSQKYSDFTAIMCVSHTFKTLKVPEIEKPIQQKLYTSVIMAKLKHMVKKNQFIDKEIVSEVLKCQTLSHFDDVFTSKNLGLKDHFEYYRLLDVHDKLNTYKSPVLFLTALDDPFTREECFPFKEIVESHNCALVTLPVGGHVSFLYGMDAQSSFQDKMALDWFNSFL